MSWRNCVRSLTHEINIIGEAHFMRHIDTESMMLASGAAFSQLLLAGDVVFFNGDLGAGKTTFVKGILQGLGFQGLVKSPTYPIMLSYQIAHFSVRHCDFYRLNDMADLEYIGFFDVEYAAAITLIEWPNTLSDLSLSANYVVTIKPLLEGREVLIVDEGGHEILY